MTNQAAAALAEVTAALESAIARYEHELIRDRGGFVFCWPASGLCVALVNGKSSVVGPELATRFRRNEQPYKFTNGKGEHAQLIRRTAALQINLKVARKALADFRAVA